MRARSSVRPWTTPRTSRCAKHQARRRRKDLRLERTGRKRTAPPSPGSKTSSHAGTPCVPGAAWDRQRDLFRALIDHQVARDRRLDRLLDRRLDERLEEPLRTADEARSALAGEHAEQRQPAVELRARIGDILGAVNEIRVILTTLRDRQESLRVRQSQLEMGHAALRERLPEAETSGPASSIPLTPRDVAELLVQLEAGVPPESRPGAVEVSLQDARAEDLLLAARRHFGGRMSSAGPRYRAPNDLWVHIDFTADWSRPVLLENAAARLQPGGRFLLVTATGHGEAPQHPQLALEDDRGWTVPSGGTVRVV